MVNRYMVKSSASRAIALGKYCCFLVVKAWLDHSLTVVALLEWGCFWSINNDHTSLMRLPCLGLCAGFGLFLSDWAFEQGEFVDVAQSHNVFEIVNQAGEVIEGQEQQRQDCDDPHCPPYLLEFAGDELYYGEGDEAKGQTRAYAVAQGDHHHDDKRGECFVEIVEVNFSDLLHHEAAAH